MKNPKKNKNFEIANIQKVFLIIDILIQLFYHSSKL